MHLLSTPTKIGKKAWMRTRKQKSNCKRSTYVLRSPKLSPWSWEAWFLGFRNRLSWLSVFLFQLHCRLNQHSSAWFPEEPILAWAEGQSLEVISKNWSVIVQPVIWNRHVVGCTTDSRGQCVNGSSSRCWLWCCDKWTWIEWDSFFVDWIVEFFEKNGIGNKLWIGLGFKKDSTSSKDMRKRTLRSSLSNFSTRFSRLST